MTMSKVLTEQYVKSTFKEKESTTMAVRSLELGSRRSYTVCSGTCFGRTQPAGVRGSDLCSGRR